MSVPLILSRVAAACCVAAPLGGCAAYDNILASLAYHQSAEVASNQTDLFDGGYKGLVRVEQAVGPGCPPEQNGTLEIGDRSLFFAYTPATLFITPIAADGTLSGSAGDSMLEGRAEDGFIHFVITSPGCRVSYRFRYAA